MGRKRKEEFKIPAERGLPWKGDTVIRGKLISPCCDVHIEKGMICFPWPDLSLQESGKDAAIFLWANGWETVEALEPLMPRFLYLTDATENEILSFANQWGPLWWSGDRSNPFFRPGGLDREESLFLDLEWQRERVWRWKGKEAVDLFSSAASLLSFLVRTALGLKLGPVALERNVWEERIGPFLVPGVFGVHFGDISRIAPSSAVRILERLLPIRNLGRDCKEGAPLELLVFDGFLPIVAAETVIAITKERDRFFVCDGCGRLYFRDRKLPGKDQLNFCDKCTIGGKVAKRLYARKVRSSKSG